MTQGINMLIQPRNINFSSKEKTIISQAIQKGHKSWKDKKVKAIKKKIKTFLKGRYKKCCYCQRPMTGEGDISIDIEHFLPKGSHDYVQFMFTMENLSLSCKRCNMTYKGTKTNFIKKTVGVTLSDLRTQDNFLIVNPALEKMEESLKRLAFLVDDFQLVYYQRFDDVGNYTYEFFELENFVLNSFNSGQGIDSKGISILENNPFIKHHYIMAGGLKYKV